MISVVCVYNKESMYTDVLLKSLQKQTVGYELIALDNSDGRFRSAAEAYNFGGGKAKGDYIMFAHQDVWLVTKTWLEDAEYILNRLPNVGVAGVAGTVSVTERNRRAHFASSCHFFDETMVAEHPPVWAPQEVETLDECLLLVPRSVFDKLKFDATVFDAWDCYAADYSLCAEDLGLKAYVIPAPCSHCCARAGLQSWEFKDLLRCQKRLYSKHRHKHETIPTWMGDINSHSLRMWSMQNIVGPLRHRLVPSPDTFLKRELAGCESVLDLNCGYDHSSLGRLRLEFSLGLDPSERYVRESKRRALHGEYVVADIRALPFKVKSFDAVVGLDTLERLSKEESTALLHRMEELATKRVIVTTPNSHTRRESGETDRLCIDQRGWEPVELIARGFRVRGGGRTRADRGMPAPKHRLAVVRLFASILDQLAVYFCPASAEKLMAVKAIKSADSR